MLDNENMNDALSHALDGVQATGTGPNASLEFDDAALASAAELFLNKNHATAFRIERKLFWSHDRAAKAIEVLVSKGVLSSSADERFDVVTANLRKFLGKDKVVEQIPEPAEPIAPETSETPETPETPEAAAPAPVAEVTVAKVRFSTPLAGIRDEKPQRKSRKDELFSLLDDIDKVEIPGLISGKERIEKIRQAAREIQNMVDATNSGIRRMELAGKKVSRENNIRFLKYDPVDGALGGVKLLVKGRDGRPKLIWQVCWEKQFNQTWLDSKTEGAASACQRHLKNLGGYALLKGK